MQQNTPNGSTRGYVPYPQQYQSQQYQHQQYQQPVYQAPHHQTEVCSSVSAGTVSGAEAETRQAASRERDLRGIRFPQHRKRVRLHRESGSLLHRCISAEEAQGLRAQ